LDGNSHVLYAEEEAGGTRLLIDGKTCLLQVKCSILAHKKMFYFALTFIVFVSDLVTFAIFEV
jgi:hypothetical protein